MIPVRPQDTKHKAWLLRLLSEIADNPLLSQMLYFKGGTCAAMLSYLDRFSVDLDFDVKEGGDKQAMRREFYKVFGSLDMRLAEASQKALEFWVKYEAEINERNTIKVDALDMVVKANKYEAKYLPEIDRVVMCQTVETMFGNKLVAPWDRWEKHKSIAGRDIYDIHHFFFKGYRYLPEIIRERTGMKTKDFLANLINFVEGKITETVIDQDINTLLPTEKFRQIRKILKMETLRFLKEERERV
jgi:hypothetical protein